MKAITCKYLPATNRKPARVKAADLDGNSAVVSCEGDRDDIRAVKELCRKMDWKGRLVEGHLKSGTVFVWASGPVIEV